MAEMSRAEKFFINRFNRYFYGRIVADLEGLLNLSLDSQVLEIGGGNGALAILVNDRYHPAKIFVTDYDPEQVELAKKNVARRYGFVPSNFVIERADALALPYPDQAFDAVVAFAVFHHLGKLPQVFRGLDEISRVLKPGGQLVYAELFHKKDIRYYLTGKDLEISQRGRRRRLLGLAEIVVMTKTGQQAPGFNMQKPGEVTATNL